MWLSDYYQTLSFFTLVGLLAVAPLVVFIASAWKERGCFDDAHYLSASIVELVSMVWGAVFLACLPALWLWIPLIGLNHHWLVNDIQREGPQPCIALSIPTSSRTSP